jgi:general secretion pathway protein K
MWLAAALAAIAFSLSNTVRGETERAATSGDGLRAYHLAAGAVQRGALQLMWSLDGSAYNENIGPGRPLLLQFPTGAAVVEFIPESSKLNINSEPPEVLFRLLTALGADPARAREAALAIDDWRTPLPPNAFSQFDQFYLAQSPSFRANHASFQETEELLLVKGVTPDLYYGAWAPNPEAADNAPRLAPRGGLRDCVSVFGSHSAFDVNSVRPEVLLAFGVAPDVVGALVQRRRIQPFTSETLQQSADLLGPAVARLTIGGGSIWTVRATARLRLPDGKFSDLKRTVAAMVKFMPPGYDSPLHVLRWYDMDWSN